MSQDAFNRYVPDATPIPSPDLTVTQPWQLTTYPLVSGHGPPTHTPIIAKQIYTDMDDGYDYVWWGEEWH